MPHRDSQKTRQQRVNDPHSALHSAMKFFAWPDKEKQQEQRTATDAVSYLLTKSCTNRAMHPLPMRGAMLYYDATNWEQLTFRLYGECEGNRRPQMHFGHTCSRISSLPFLALCWHEGHTFRDTPAMLSAVSRPLLARKIHLPGYTRNAL